MNNQQSGAAATLRFDYAGMMRDIVGDNGFTADDLNDPRFAQAAAAMRAKRNDLEMAFRRLPFEQGPVVAQIQAQAQRIRERCDTLVVFGIGGSALGPLAVQQALNHTHYNELPQEQRGGPRLYVLDNIDPVRTAALLGMLDLKKTCFNVISKSGQTSESMAQLLIAIDALTKAGLPPEEHIIATTDAHSGSLVRIAREQGLPMLTIPDGVGGRFSELTPVGLLAAAVCGIDIQALLDGAAHMDHLLDSDDVMQNMAYLDGAFQYLCMQRGINVSVMMPYADQLKLMSDWYAQLWAESLGKNVDRAGNPCHVGQTPVKALGVTDQHSQMQLYTEGPFDKVITFLTVERFDADVTIPPLYEHIDDVAFLGGHSLSALMAAEQRASEYALAQTHRLHKKIILPHIDAFTIGQLLYLLEMETAYLGELLNINAFDQPGVEEGKQGTYALMGKAGYDQKRAQMEAHSAQGSRYRLG